MNQYRVDLWIENEGDIPDFYFQLQMNVEPVSYELIEAVMLLARCWSVRKVEICRLSALRLQEQSHSSAEGKCSLALRPVTHSMSSLSTQLFFEQ